MQNKFIINIDWLSYSAYGIVGETTLFNRYKVVPKEHGSQVFKNLASIVLIDTAEEVAQIQYNPRSSALKPNLCIVKIANRCLYEYDYISLIKSINAGLNLEYNALSRLDICADFYTFETIHPQQLIKQFLQRKLRRFGKSKYVLHGNQDRPQEYEYLRFGSPTSEVITYLYNKSLEMREVKHKPYIVRQWSQLSFPYGDIQIEPDVWRLEFRLNGDNIKCICDENAELHQLNINELGTKQVQKLLFTALVNKFWRWAKAGKEKFIDCQEVAMFDLSKCAFVINERKDERQEVRTAIKFLDTLEKVTQELNVGVFAEDILRRQFHSQLPQASQELKKKSTSKEIVSFLRHWMQAEHTFNIDPFIYAMIDVKLKYNYTDAYERAERWAERHGYRNSGDTF